MKKLLLSLISIVPATFFGQVITGEALLNNANVKFNTNGVMFEDFANSLPGYEAPYGTDLNAIFSASIWMGGLDPADNLHMAAQTFCQESSSGFCEYYPGPLKTDGSASTTVEVQNQYNRFWYISRSNVDTHIAYSACLNDPDCDVSTEFPGYSIPGEITDWPAHGDTDAGYAQYLAPFIDSNSDGIYNPEDGDYPSFTGDAAVYYISNDNGGPHASSQGVPLGMEIHTLFYYYYDNDPSLSATMFVHQDFINRSDTNYHDVYLGIFNDFDLGNPSDDFIGTDVENAYVYAYNGDAFDDPSSSGPGYGDDLSAIACKILAGPYIDPNNIDDLSLLNSDQQYGDYTTGFADGIIDNERMGLSSSMYANNNSGPTGAPTNAFSYYNSLKSIWLNGVPLTFGGTGYDPTAQSPINSKYVYFGDTDPLFEATGSVDPNYPLDGGWTEVNEAHSPGDRRITANCGPFTFNAGQKQSLDYMYVFARQSDNPGEDLHDLLTAYVTAAASRPDSLPVGVVSTVKTIHADEIGFNLYPNPADGSVTLTLSGDVQATYRIYNVLGAQVSSGELNADETKIDISTLDNGFYLVNITVEGRTATQKLVVR